MQATSSIIISTRVFYNHLSVFISLSSTPSTHSLLLQEKKQSNDLPLDSSGSITRHIYSRMDLLYLLLQHWLRTFNRRIGGSRNNHLRRQHHTARHNILLHIIYIRHTACRIPVRARKEIAVVQTDSLPTRQQRAQTHTGNAYDLDFMRPAVCGRNKPHHILPLQHRPRSRYRHCVGLGRRRNNIRRLCH